MRIKHSNLVRYSATVFLAMTLVLSCSHKENPGEGDEAAAGDEAAQSENAAAENSDTALTQDESAVPTAEGDAASKEPSDAALSELESTVGDGKANPEAEAVAPPTEETAPVADAGAPKNADVAPPPAEGTASLQADAGAPPINPEIVPETAPEPTVQNAPVDMSTAPVPPPELDTPAEAKIPPITIPTTTAAAPKKAHHKGHHAKHKKSSSTKVATAHVGNGKALQAPRIPGKAFTKKGANLNRFYFVRRNDNPKNVAQLLYGNVGKAKDLITWNGTKAWKAGSLIYYASLTEAQDTKMQAFYQERNVPVEEYTVQGPDTLFTIAQSKLGDKGSWKEIAAVNGMETSGGLEPGQKLALYTANLKDFTVDKSGPKVAEVPKAVTPAPAVQTPPIEQAPPPPQNAEPPVQEPPKLVKTPAGPGGLDIALLVQQNIFAVGIGGFILILLIALMALNRKKKGNREEFADENFNPPRARRK